MRLFVASPLPGSVRERLDRGLAPLRSARRDVRWSDPAGWHLTLAFLGEVPSLGPVIDAVHPIALRHAPSRLRLAGVGRFGNRVLWVAVADEPPEALGRLAVDVVASLQDAGFLIEERPFRAHLTLARRSRSGVDPALVRAASDALEQAAADGPADASTDPSGGPSGAPGVTWSADRVEIWRSHLGRGPARYEVVASFPTGG